MRAVGLYLRRAVSVCVITTALAAVCAPPAWAQIDEWGYWENGVSEPWRFSTRDFTEADASAVVARWKAIGGGAASAHPWAGDYFVGGDTHGTYVRWSPEGGFVIAHINKCAAQAVGVLHGRAELTPTVVKFTPEFRGGAPSPHAHGEHAHGPRPAPAELRFVPVEWRGERLLVAEDEMADFGDYAAGLGQYNGWDVFLIDHTTFLAQMRGPGSAPAARRGDRPAVPPGYERFLKRPIEASVVAVGRSRDVRDYEDKGLHATHTYAHVRLTPVTVNAGTEHGVVEGLRFRVRRPSEGDMVRVVRAGRRTSEAVVIRTLDQHGRATFYDNEADEERAHTPVRAGWKLTTSLF